MNKLRREELDEKVEEFTEMIDEGSEINDAGVETVISLPEFHLLPFGLPVHEFYLEELQYFSKSLIDSGLKPHTNAVTRDFSAYWGWIAALISHLERKQAFKEYQEIINDYYYLVHSALVSERHSDLMRINPNFHISLAQLNPSFAEITLGGGLPLAATFGFSVLEGLLKRRCNDLMPDSRTNIRRGFQTLIEDSEVSPMVREVIQEIDDLDRYNRDVLERKMAGIPDLSNRDSLLWLIKEQRNYNIHGEGSTQAIGSLVLTLCSLVLLDEITESEYSEAQIETIKDIQRSQRHPMGRSHPPRSLYPIEMF